MSDELAQVQRKIATLQKRIRRIAERKQARNDLVDWQALLLFIYSRYRADVAAHFHLSMASSCSSLEDAIAHVEWSYINAPLESKVDLMFDPCKQRPKHQVLVAFRFLLWFQLREWLRRMNFECGVAPSRRMLVDRVRCLVPSNLPAGLQAQLLRPLATPRGQRKYFNAFRKRFGCKLGRLHIVPPMSLEEKQSKAG